MCINLADGKNATATTTNILYGFWCRSNDKSVRLFVRFVILPFYHDHLVYLYISALLTDTPLFGKEYIYII